MIVNFKVLVLKSTTIALALDVLPVTTVPVAKKVGSTNVIDGIIGSSWSKDSYIA